VIPKKPGDKPVSTDYIREWREFIGQYPYGDAYDWLQFIQAENRQGNIPVSECQDIIRKLSLKSFESEYKILIMWRPEYLGKEGNRLLKIIEEPPPKTLFILVAEKQEQILNTILSRTQLVKVYAPQKEEVASALTGRLHMDATMASRIAALAGGNYREALRLAQHTEQDWLQELRDWLNYIVRQQSRELLQWIDRIASSKTGRENQKQFLRYFITLLGHSLRLRFLSEEAPPLPPEEQDFALKLNKLADPLQVNDMIKELDAACYHIERNANGKILFHALSIRLQYIFSRRGLPAL
jgi:DNA polymerase-3 subunit delta'